MSSSDELEKCKTLLKEFIDDKLYGNIDNLKKYSFFNLYDEKDSKYCSSYPEDVWKFDPDSSKISNSIYFLVWKDKIKDLKFSDIGNSYRGETLNSFKTLFGEDYWRAKKNVPDDNGFYKKIENYKSIYLSIGNFMLLPNGSVPVGENDDTKTMNTYRGNYTGLRDYFDSFLYELELCLINSPKKDGILMSLRNENDFYFKKIKNIKMFAKVNYLETYFDENYKNKLIFGKEPNIWRLRRNLTEVEKEQYKRFSENFISKAIEVIDYRAERIVDSLKSIL